MFHGKYVWGRGWWSSVSFGLVIFGCGCIIDATLSDSQPLVESFISIFCRAQTQTSVPRLHYFFPLCIPVYFWIIPDRKSSRSFNASQWKTFAMTIQPISWWTSSMSASHTFLAIPPVTVSSSCTRTITSGGTEMLLHTRPHKTRSGRRWRRNFVGAGEEILGADSWIPVWRASMSLIVTTYAFSWSVSSYMHLISIDDMDVCRMSNSCVQNECLICADPPCKLRNRLLWWIQIQSRRMPGDDPQPTTKQGKLSVWMESGVLRLVWRRLRQIRWHRVMWVVVRICVCNQRWLVVT